MLLVNDDNNNDELFRRAAEHYPLKTDKPDWDAVLAKMNAADNPDEEAIPVAKKRKNNSRYLLLLLLLIPLALFENKTSFFRELAGGKNNGPANTTTAKQEPVQPGNSNPSADQTTTQPDDQSGQQSAIGTENTIDKKQDANIVSTDKPVQNAVQKNNPVSNSVTDNSIVSGNKRNYTGKQKSRVKIINAKPGEDEVVVVQYPDTKNNSKNKKAAVSTATETNKDITSAERSSPVQKEIDARQKVAITQAETETVSNDVNKETTPADKKDALKEDAAAKQEKKDVAKTEEKKKPVDKEEKKKKAGTKHFYLGVVGGPDFSAVKLQSMKRTGISYGLLAGYRISKRLSIETGILQDKKYYSTDGKYFDPKGLNLPPSYNIEYVNGLCKMLEVPLNIKYTFKQGARSGWFGSVGASSYIMQHESYTYDISYGGYNYSKDYDYANKSTSIFAVINLSAGYTYKLGKIGSLRFEPYVRIPVNKIGTGKLPIQSGGIYLGFIKDIF